ncbi:ribose 5-phosphate isomerase B [candidate division KSB1 bacterium]
MKIIIGCDHAGFDLKKYISEELRGLNIDFEDIGAFSEDSVDYPDYGIKVAESVSEGSFDKGILICGAGIGMSIVANKVKNIRAALCMTPEQAELSRRHNDSNILVMAGRLTGKETAKEILNKWLKAEFEGGRHERRIIKIHDLTGN